MPYAAGLGISEKSKPELVVRETVLEKLVFKEIGEVP